MEVRSRRKEKPGRIHVNHLAVGFPRGLVDGRPHRPLSFSTVPPDEVAG